MKSANLTSDIDLPIGIVKVDVVAERHAFRKGEISDASPVHPSHAPTRAIHDGRKFRGRIAHGMPAELDEVKPCVFARLTNGLLRLPHRFSGDEHLATYVQARDADLPDLLELRRNLFTDVDRVLGVADVAPVFRVKFGNNNITLFEGRVRSAPSVAKYRAEDARSRSAGARPARSREG